MRPVHGLVLVLTVLGLAAKHGVDCECQDWSVENDSNLVCCRKCKPGTHMVNDCGSDPKALCTPCNTDEYISDTTQKSCLRCTQCIGIQRVKEKCSPSRDTVCECSQGFLCGDTGCSFCVKECVAGQQPINRTCEPCPPGTYNNKTHHHCVRWTKCTKPDHQIIVPGTSKSDVNCGPKREPAQTTSSPDNRPKVLPDNKPKVLPDNSIDNKVTAILVSFGVICIVIPMILILYLERKKIRTSWKKHETKDAAAAGQIRAALPEECSFCFPQQEHGGSSQTSMSSLVSDDKAMPLVG